MEMKLCKLGLSIYTKEALVDALIEAEKLYRKAMAGATLHCASYPVSSATDELFRLLAAMPHGATYDV